MKELMKMYKKLEKNSTNNMVDDYVQVKKLVDDYVKQKERVRLLALKSEVKGNLFVDIFPVFISGLAFFLTILEVWMLIATEKLQDRTMPEVGTALIFIIVGCFLYFVCRYIHTHKWSKYMLVAIEEKEKELKSKK